MDPRSLEFSGEDVSASSGKKAAAAANVSLAAVANKTNFVTGFDIAGATAASVIDVTLTGLKDGTLQFEVAIPAGATASLQPIQIRFPYPLAASGQNIAIALNVPSFGAGNTAAAANIYGFRVG